MKVIVLLSGGMDSTTLLYQMHEEHEVVGTLSFNYGSKHNDKELPYAQHHAERLGIPHKVIPLDFIAEHFSSGLLKTGGEIPEGHYEDSNMVQTVVPFRNGIMMSIAAGFAESIGAEAVGIAAHSGDHAVYRDCRAPFMDAMDTAITEGTYAEIKVLRPFVGIRKEDIAALGDKLKVDFKETWSCYKGEERHCGKCGTCVERKEAFLLSGVPDPTEYQGG